MSAFEAAHLIRSFRKQHPLLSNAELVQTARAIRADFYTYDYSAGLCLEGMIEDFEDERSLEYFFTAAVDALIAQRKPLWTRLAPSGRQHVIRAMGLNGAQCLRAAGLLDTSARATDWWDGLAKASRSERENRLLAQGREGERLSLAYEAERLDREGISRRPTWVAIEDNTVGYDILSYALSDGNEVSRLIEVKTSSGPPSRMIISRNEWKAAEQFADAFQFHHWRMDSRSHKILSVNDMRPHIPTDTGRGTWEAAEILLND